MNIIAWIIYIPLQILAIPLAIVGVILVTYKQLWRSKQLGVSQTAIEVINNRWMMHIFGLREDKVTKQLIHHLPNTSPLGLWLALLPLYARYKISGEHALFPTLAKEGEEGIAHIVFNRTLYFDRIIEKHSNTAQQFVAMGAGFDTRCYGDLTQNMTRFELDQATTQELKHGGLRQAEIDTSQVTFVEVDFSQTDWQSVLETTSYDPNKKTIFLWEGVTLYLSESSVRQTLRIMKSLAPTGSVIVADIYALSFVRGEYMRGMKATFSVLDMTDEGFGFGLDYTGDYQQILQTFVESEGMTLEDTYFMGHKTDRGAYMVVAEITI